jgi:hypothetical protein
MAQHPTENCDAIVVGGNVAGLFVAYMLGQLGYSTKLLEKQPVLGGMDRSFTNRNGRSFDFGLHVLDSLRSDVVTKLFRHVVDNEVHETERRRGIVLRNHVIPYNAVAGDWPEELRELLPDHDLVDEVGDAKPTRRTLARYYGEGFADMIFDEVLASYPSETRQLEFGVEESQLITHIYPWFFPRARLAPVNSNLSRQYHDRKRAGAKEVFLYPRQGGFGGFAEGFRRKLHEIGVEVLTDIPDLHFEMQPAKQRVSRITAQGRQLYAPRVFWCAPGGILCRLLSIDVEDLKPDQFVLGSFEFSRPVDCDYHELILGDPQHLFNRMSFPGKIGRTEDNLCQLEFSYPRHAPGEFVTDERFWKEKWLASLRKMGIVDGANEPVDFDLKTVPLVYNCYGVEGKKQPDFEIGELHPESNLRPVLLSVNNININTRIPQFLRYLTDELGGSWIPR